MRRRLWRRRVARGLSHEDHYLSRPGTRRSHAAGAESLYLCLGRRSDGRLIPAGIYSSGISAAKEGGEDIVTANDIRQNAGTRKIEFWVTNDACPPSPGCVFPKRALRPTESGIDFAGVWQFAQSPKRPAVAASCPGYNPDGNCYPPGVDVTKHLHIDVNTAATADPSMGRRP